MKRLLLVLVLVLGTSLVGVQPASAADDDTYERICLTLGWTSCGEWTIYDANGVQLNRVVGPTPLSSFTAYIRCQTANVNLCGDSSRVPLGSAVQTGTFSPPTEAVLAARAAAATAAANAAATAAANAAATAAATAAANAAATAAANAAANAATSGLGGYAVVHSDGHVCGVIVGSSKDPYGNGGTMPTEYMGCPAGSRIIFQTKASSSGNVAGWSGVDVFYLSGVFILGNGTTISNGIATDTDGRVWDTGSGVTIKAGTVTISAGSTQISTGSTQTGAPTATTQIVAPAPTTQTDTSTVTTQTVAPAPTTQTVAPAPTTQTEAPAPTAQTEAPVPTTQTDIPAVSKKTDTPSATAQLTMLSSSEKENLLRVMYKSSKASTLSVSTDVANADLVITATKKGFPTLTFKLKTNDAGDANVKAAKNLAGYTVTLSSDKIKLDSDKVNK
jgi:hypothetical protein